MTRPAMIAFEVSLNGTRVCTAGVEDFGVLSTILTWVRRKPQKRRDGKTAEEELTVEVGGLDSRAPGAGENLQWLAHALRVGDTVSIRVIETGVVDEPRRRYRDDPEVVERAKRRYYERLKKELEDTPSSEASIRGAATTRRSGSARRKSIASRRRRGGSPRR